MRRLLWIAGWVLFATIGSSRQGACRGQEPLNSETIGPGYILEVTIRDEPDLSHSYTVDKDGNVTVTLEADDPQLARKWQVSVGGKTALQARQALTASLDAYIRSPDVTVRIVTAPKLDVEIRGAVDRRGTMAVRGGAHLSDALTDARYAPNADLAHVMIMRKGLLIRTSNGDSVQQLSETLHVDFRAFLKGESDTDPTLASGDVIVVPVQPEEPTSRLPKTARIVGEVTAEVTVQLSPGMRMHELFARAGGLKSTADRKLIRLIRGQDGRIELVDADSVEALDGRANVVLTSGDLVIVPARDHGQAYAVLGEVAIQKTITYPTNGHVTVSQALLEAGGMARSADRHHGVIKRGYLIDPAAAREQPFDPERVYTHQVPDIALEPGDVVVVLAQRKRPNLLQELAPLLLRFLPL